MGEYKITPIEVEGFSDADGVYVNEEGAWLGEVTGEHVQPYSDGGSYVPAPSNWQELIVEKLN